MSDRMTKGERTELLSLVKKREKVMKSQAEERSALLLAEFDAQSAKIHHYDDDVVWKQVHADAEAAVEQARQQVAERCKQLGIPEEFAPDLSFGWFGRGHNAVASRRQELRRAAKSRVEALEKEAITKIERLSLQAQTDILARGLETQAAKKFLESMPDMKALMPPIEIGEIQNLIETRKAQGRLEHYH
jgi:hypothetical protein